MSTGYPRLNDDDPHSICVVSVFFFPAFLRPPRVGHALADAVGLLRFVIINVDITCNNIRPSSQCLVQEATTCLEQASHFASKLSRAGLLTVEACRRSAKQSP